MIYNKFIFGNIDFSLTRDPQQKLVVLKKSSLRKIATNLECLPKFFFLRRSPSNQFSSIFGSTPKFLLDPTTEPGLNIVKHLKIPEFKDIDFSAEYISHPALKAIMKFRNDPIVSAIRNAFNPQSFNFSKVSVDDVLKEINKLGNRKAIQNTDIPVKILKTKC